MAPSKGHPPTFSEEELARICERCGYRMGQHVGGGQCPIYEEWYCFECCGLGTFPAEPGWQEEDEDCTCCSENDHESDAALPPPCHPEARAIAVASGDYSPFWTKRDWERAERLHPIPHGIAEEP